MEITLNHTIIPSQNHVDSAKFYSEIFGFEYVKEWGPFALVKVNSSLTLDFQIQENFSSLHFAFKVNEQQFDEIFERIKNGNIKYGSGPFSSEDGKINHNDGGRGLYFSDADGHILEIITKDYVID